ncbi:hypothetical protein D3C85_1389060 [compost metagenome]
MMLLSDIPNRFGKLIFLKHFHPVPCMGHNNRLTQLRINEIMRVLHIILVLDEIAWPFRLTNVVIIRPDSAQQSVRTNGFRRRFRQIADHDTMVIGSRRLRKQLS